MKVAWGGQVRYMDINPEFRMRLGALSRCFHEAAVTHSEPVGLHHCDLVANGTAWVLNKMAFDFRRLPALGEDLRVVTWHKGSRGFRAYRDFEVMAGDEILASVIRSPCFRWKLMQFAHGQAARIPGVRPDMCAP